MNNQLNILGKIVESKLNSIKFEINDQYISYIKIYSINISQFEELVFFLDAEKIMISNSYVFNFSGKQVFTESKYVYFNNRIFLSSDFLDKINFKFPELRTNEFKRIVKIANNLNYSKILTRLDGLSSNLIEDAKKLNIDVVDFVYKKIQEQNIKDVLDD